MIEHWLKVIREWMAVDPRKLAEEDRHIHDDLQTSLLLLGAIPHEEEVERFSRLVRAHRDQARLSQEDLDAAVARRNAFLSAIKPPFPGPTDGQ